MKLRAIVVGLAGYAAIWLITELVGSRQVGDEVMQRLITANGGRAPSTASIKEWMALDASDMAEGELYPYPRYFAGAHSPAPFVVIVEEGTTNGLLAGHGGTSVFVWVFGFTWRVSHKATWIS